MMRRLLLLLLLLLPTHAFGLPSYCTITGTVLDAAGNACGGCKVSFTTAGNQEVGGSTFPGGKVSSWTTEADGDLPAGVQIARTLIVKIQIDKGNAVTVQIPDSSTANISSLLLEPVTLPSSTNINSLAGTLNVSKGGTGAAPSGDDQVLVSSSTTGAAWDTLVDCDAAGSAVSYDTTANNLACNTAILAADLSCSGCVAAADLASNAVTEEKLKAVDAPSDEECLTYETTTGDFEWQTCGGGGGGTGDVETVGDCTGPACFEGTTGNSLQFEGATANGFETTLTATDPTADRTATLPNFSGTIAMERVYDARAYGAVCNDSTDDAAAIQAAIDAAEATGQGGVVELPVGICVVNTGLNMNEPGVVLRGQGMSTSNNMTVLSCNTGGTGTCVTLDTSCTYCGVEKMQVTGRGVVTDIMLVDGTNASNDFVRDVITTNYCTGIKNVLRNDRIDLFGPVAGASCRAISIVDNGAYLNRVTGNWSTDIEGMVVIEQTGTNIVDTVVISDTEIAQSGGAGAALKIIGASTTNPPRWIQVSNSLFEAKTTGATTGDYPLYIDNVKEFKCTNCYFHGGYRAVVIDGGPGPIRFVNSEIGDARREALYHNADVPTELIATTVSDGSQETTNTYSGVYLSASSRQFTMIGGRASDDLFFSGSGQKYGIEIISGADEYRFDNVGCEGNDTACAVGLSTAAAQAAFTDGTAYADSDWSNYVLVRAPSLSGNWTLTLPTTDGNANEILQTDGSGTTTWVAATSFESALEGVLDLQDLQGAVTDAQVPDTITASSYLPLAGGTMTGNLVLSGDAGEGVSGGGLSDCDNATTSKLLWDTTTNKFSCGTDQTGAGGGDAITVNSSAATDPDFLNGDIDWTLTGGNSITATVACTGCVDSTDLADSIAATTFTGALVGNADTATALAANPSDCGADTYATTIAASGNLTCASITNASTTGTALNTPSTLVLRDGSGNFAAGTITAALTGNASTATALAANPADCASDTYATTIAASGALTCSTVTNAGLAGSIAMSKTLLTADAGLVLSTNSLATASAETGFVTGSTSLPGTCGEGAVYQDTDSGGTETYVCTASNTWTKLVAATDNVATATALAANGANCSAGSAPRGVDASGAAEDCTAYLTAEVDGSTTNELQNIFQTIDASSGTDPVADTTTDTLVMTGTAPVTVTGDSAADSVTLSLADVTDCSANQYVNAVGANLALTCAQPDHGNLAGLSDDDHTQYFLLAGRTLADPAAATTVIARQTTSSPLAMTNGSGFEWLEWDADLTIPNTSTIQVFSVMGSLDRTGTSGGDLYQYTGFYGQPTLSSATTGGPLFQDMFYDASIIDQTANTATQNTWVPISFLSKPTYKVSGTGTLTIGKTMAGNTDPNLTETGTGNLTITELIGWNVMDATTTAGTPTVTEQVGFRCEDLTAGTTDTCYKSEGTSVLFKHAGQARIGATGAPTANFDLDVQGATKVADYMDVGDDIADITTGTVGVITIGDTVNISSTGDLSGLLFTPTTTNSGAGSGELYGVYFSPTLSSNSIDTLSAVSMAGTVTQTAKVAGLFSGASYVLNHNTTYQSATAAVHPREGVFAINNLPTVTMSATSSSATQPNNIAVVHNPTVSNTGAGGTFTLTNDVGLKMTGTYTETAGTLQVTNRIGLDFDDVTNTSSATAITTNIGVDIAALSTATTNIGIRNADTTVYTPCVDDISGNTDYLAQPACTALNLTAGGARNLTGGTDQIANGVDGQIVHIFFTGGNSITFDDGDNLNLAAATRALSASDTLTLLYSSTAGEWIEIGFANN